MVARATPLTLLLMRNTSLRLYRQGRTVLTQAWQHPASQPVMRWALTLLALGYIAWRLWHESVWQTGWQLTWTEGAWLGVIGAVILLPLNLGLEVAKWRQLVRLVLPDFNWHQATSGVLLGAATGIFTPNRMGDYAGRLMCLPAEHHLLAAVYTFVSRIAQMASTLVLGSTALLALSRQPGGLAWAGPHQDLLLSGTLLLTSGAAFAFAFPQVVLGVLRRLPWRKGLIGQAIQALTTLPPSLIRRIGALALLRSAVFTTQYALLLCGWLGAEHLVLACALVSLIFLLKSVVPSVALAELGLRESVALLVTGAVGWAASPVVVATFGLYVINLIIPALLGLACMSWLARR